MKEKIRDEDWTTTRQRRLRRNRRPRSCPVRQACWKRRGRTRTSAQLLDVADVLEEVKVKVRAHHSARSQARSNNDDRRENCGNSRTHSLLRNLCQFVARNAQGQ